MFHVKQSAFPIFSLWCFTWNIAIFFPCISHQAQLFFLISIFLCELHRQLNNRGFPLVILSPIYHQSSYYRLLIWNLFLRQLPIFFRNISYFRLLYLPTNYIIIYPWNSPGKRYEFTALLSQKFLFLFDIPSSNFEVNYESKKQNHHCCSSLCRCGCRNSADQQIHQDAVSYTHLTLPTTVGV